MMKFLRVSLVCVSVMTLPAQAGSYQGIIGAAPNTSANNFYSLISGDTTLTQAQFASYYVPNYATVSKESSVSALLDQYINDVQAKNYTQAQIDLVRLAAVVFRYTNIPGVAREIEVAVDPWTGGAFYLAGDGLLLDQNMVNSFVQQFASLYKAMKANPSAPNNPINTGGNNNNNNNGNNTGGNNNNPSGPSNTGTGSTTNAQLYAAQQLAINQIQGLESSAVLALNQAEADLSDQMSDLEEKALSDSNIADDKAKAEYFSQLTGLISAEGPNIATTVSTAISNIRGVQTSVSNVINLLVNGDIVQINNYMGAVNAQASASIGIINDAQDRLGNSIDELEQDISNAIAGAGVISKSATPEQKSFWESTSGIVLGVNLVEWGTAALTYIGLKILCKKIPTIVPVCPRKSMLIPENIKKRLSPEVTDFIDKLEWTDIKSGVSELMAQGKLANRAIRLGLANTFNLTEDQFGVIVSDADLAGFVAQTNELIGMVQTNFPGLAAEDITAILADGLIHGRYTVATLNTSLEDLANQIVFELRLPPAMGSSPISGTVFGSITSNQWEQLSGEASLQNLLIDNIKAQKVTLSEFQAQIGDLELSLRNLQDQVFSGENDAAEIEILEEEIAAQQVQLDAARDIENNWAELIPKDL